MSVLTFQLKRGIQAALHSPTLSEPTPEPSQATAEAANAAPTPSTSSAKNVSALKAVLRVAGLTVKGFVLGLWYAMRTVLRYLRYHPIHACLNIVFLAIIALVVFTGSEIHKQLILAKISEQTVDEIIKGSRFTRSYDSEEIAKNGVREFLQVGAPEWAQREGVRAILFQARKAGLGVEDQASLLAIADIESGFNPMARAPTTSACGLFQFVKRTGESFDLSASDCMNPWLNARSEIDHYTKNFERRVKSHVADLEGSERVFRTFELSYYLHHDGPESSNPSNDVKATVLSGTQFLFKAYHALLQEAESEKHAPSFVESFSANFLRAMDRIASFFHDSGSPSMGPVGELRNEAAKVSA